MQKSRQQHYLEGKKTSVCFSNKHQKNQAQLQLSSRSHVIHKCLAQRGQHMDELAQTCIKYLQHEV